MSQEHTFASPAPAGLAALAMACLCFYAMLTGKVTHAAAPVLACWMVGGGIVQVIVAVIELRDHNFTGGNAFLFFAAFFMFTTAFSLVTKYGLASAGLDMDTRIEGWGWLAGAIFLILMTPSYLKATKLMFVLVILVDFALLGIAILDLKVDVNRALVATITAWLLLATGAIALYMVAAIATNTNFGKKVLPIPGPFIK